MLLLLTERLRPGRVVRGDRNLLAHDSLDSLLRCFHMAPSSGCRSAFAWREPSAEREMCRQIPANRTEQHRQDQPQPRGHPVLRFSVREPVYLVQIAGWSVDVPGECVG